MNNVDYFSEHFPNRITPSEHTLSQITQVRKVMEIGYFIQYRRVYSLRPNLTAQKMGFGQARIFKL